jgi:acyl carrier protein
MNNKILEIAKEILGSEITISTTMSNHPDWSSLKTIQIVMALDDAGIMIPIEKMARIKSIKDIIDISNEE